MSKFCLHIIVGLSLLLMSSIYAYGQNSNDRPDQAKIARELESLKKRIAELEATTARKGNRKVSLTMSGWVNEAVFFWDDGVEKNAYVGTNSLEQTRSPCSTP